MAENNGAYIDYPDYTPKATFFRATPRATKPVKIKSGQVIKALSFLESDAQGVCSAHSGTSESSILSFDAALTNGQTLIVAGLTFTAGSSGTTVEELVTAFSGIEDGGDGGTVDGGTFSGTFTGYNAEGFDTNSVVFNASTIDTNPTDITVTGTGVGSTTLTVSGGDTSTTPIAGVLCFDVDASAGDVNASAYSEASFWADALVWAVDVTSDTIKLPDGTLLPVTAYNTGTHGDTEATNLLKQKFVEGSKFDPLGFTTDGENNYG